MKPLWRAPRWRIARIAGIGIDLDISVLVIFLLIAFTLGTGLFPRWHPDWSAARAWAAALAAAMLFLLSLLLHELSHALVARRYGIGVPRITLFVFGGMAQMDDEPPTWRAEFWIAIAGPATSLLIGAACAMLAVYGAGAAAIDPDDIGRTLGRFGLAPTLLLWLGQVNLVLAGFNLLPGFPLDGGRILRAALWGATGQLRLATRWAGAAGQLFAWLFIGAGAAMMLGLRVPPFGGGALGGLWIALIGWFLRGAALASYRQLVLREALRAVPVARLMQTRLHGVPSDLPLDRLVDDYLLRSAQRAFPVLEADGRAAGVVGLEQVRRLAPAAWPARRAADIMTPLGALAALGMQDDAWQALDLLGQAGGAPLAVLEHGRLRGLVWREDVFKWLALHAGLAPAALAAFGRARY